jgi:hypothetical protein
MLSYCRHKNSYELQLCKYVGSYVKGKKVHMAFQHDPSHINGFVLLCDVIDARLYLLIIITTNK